MSLALPIVIAAAFPSKEMAMPDTRAHGSNQHSSERLCLICKLTDAGDFVLRASLAGDFTTTRRLTFEHSPLRDCP